MPRTISQSAKIKLYYLNWRARAEVTRLILAYASQPYEDIRLTREEIESKRSTFLFGQVPILQVDDWTLPQSIAIARFLAAQFDLCGKDDFESATCDALADGWQVDVDPHVCVWWYSDKETKGPFSGVEEKYIFPVLKRFQNILLKNGGEHFVGKQLTWFDIYFMDILDFYVSSMNPKFLDNFPVLAKFMHKIMEIPKLKNWIEKRPKTEF